MPKKMDDVKCKHKNFAGHNKITQIGESEWMADIEIHCTDCGIPFVFVGGEVGMSLFKPMVSFSGSELRAPIKPMSEPDIWYPVINKHV